VPIVVRDARFDTVLINYRLKRPYTWYELRYAVELDFSGIKEIINNREISTLFQRLNLTSIEKGKESEGKLAEVVDNIIEDDSVIIENDSDKQLMILRIIELVDPYRSHSLKK
jgi:hypothetical protein